MRPFDDDELSSYARYRMLYAQRFSFMLRTMITMVTIMLIAIGIMQFSRLMPFFMDMLEAKSEIMKAEAEGLKGIPDLESRITGLEKRTQTLTNESMDARLENIETAIRIGEVKPEALSSLQDLRDDFEVLKTYMFSKPEELVELRTLQKDYRELKQSLDKTMPRENVLREIDSIRNLFYVSLTLFGILVSVFTGSWLVTLHQTRKLEREVPGHPKETKPKD